MTKFAKIFMVVAATVIAVPVGLKLVWDDYQMGRAVRQRPIVVALIDKIRPFNGSIRIDTGSEITSTNEYAASVWRDYRADANCAAVQEHLDAEARRIGFTFHSVQRNDARTLVFHREGEYEIRSYVEPQNSGDCDYAVSVNWYGLNR